MVVQTPSEKSLVIIILPASSWAEVFFSVLFLILRQHGALIKLQDDNPCTFER